MDRVSREKRSEIMARIRSRGNRSTELRLASELRVRRIWGWRRHLRLPGTPDSTFPACRVCVFVHGCFWHGCPNCYHAPSSNRGFWAAAALAERGYQVVILWECDLDPERLRGSIQRILAALTGHTSS